jgi:hypothetical protein
MNYVTYDFYAKKKLNRFTFGAEVPIASGTIGGSNYNAAAAALEVNYRMTDVTELGLKTGYASGQTNLSSSSIDTYRAFFFNPNYHIGMIMFNYQLANFAYAQTSNNPSLNPRQLASPYNNPIVDAAYVALSANIKPWDKWTFRPGFVYAVAPQVAKNGQYFFNNWTKTVQQNNTGYDQSMSYGAEIDLGISFQWDEYFTFSLDNGVFIPGGFYAFSNTSSGNSTVPVFASSVRVGVNF